jgi:glycosyltransferase involved in cell wall biosynthesis
MGGQRADDRCGAAARVRGAVSGPPPAIGLDARKARDFGIGTYTRELTAALAAAPGAGDFRFVLFARERDRELFARLPANFSLRVANDPGYSLSELTLFPRRVRKERLALFHALHYVVPPFLGTPSVVTVHDLIHLHPDHSPKRWAYPYARIMLSRAVSRARVVITVSDTIRREIAGRYPSAAAKIEVISQGVASQFRFAPDPGVVQLLSKKYELPARYALFLGNERPHKNLKRILHSFELVGRTDREIGLVLAGPLPRSSWFGALVSSTGLAGRVRTLGVVPQEDLPGLYAGALLFLSPTLEEGFGLPAVEAMASGTPVVASAIPIWQETCGDAALLVDPRDPRAIAEAVTRLASSPEERERLRRRGLHRAAVYSWAATAEKTLRVYQNALQS